MNGQIVMEHFKKLQNYFPNLVLSFKEGKHYIRGELQFQAQFSNEDLINEIFSIELVVSDDYPTFPPVARELGGRIPHSFHTFTDGTLCLGAPVAVKRTFSKNPTLLGFVNTLIIPYLYSFSYKANNDTLPFGELEHGTRGILNYYKDFFQVKSDGIVLELLYILAFNKFRGHLVCPCKSGENLRKCHGKLLREIQVLQTNDEFMIEFLDCFDYFKKMRK